MFLYKECIPSTQEKKQQPGINLLLRHSSDHYLSYTEWTLHINSIREPTSFLNKIPLWSSKGDNVERGPVSSCYSLRPSGKRQQLTLNKSPKEREPLEGSGVEMPFPGNFLSLSNPERFWFDFIRPSWVSLQIVGCLPPSWAANHSNILLLLLISVYYQDMKGMFQKTPIKRSNLPRATLQETGSRITESFVH